MRFKLLLLPVGSCSTCICKLFNITINPEKQICETSLKHFAFLMNLPCCVSMQDWVFLCLSPVRQWTCLCRNLAADWNTPRPPSSATMSWRGSGTRLVICRLHCIVTIGAWEVKTREHVTAHVAGKQKEIHERDCWEGFSVLRGVQVICFDTLASKYQYLRGHSWQGDVAV